MDHMIFFITLTAIHGALYFFDRFFKSCMHYPYDAFLRNTGLSVNFMRLYWHTTAFNRCFLRWGSAGYSFARNFLLNSFTIGVLVSFLLLPIGVVLLIITIFANVSRSNVSSSQQLVQQLKHDGIAAEEQSIKLEIMLPGVNLPLDEIGYYISTLLICTLLHELGHAMAAVIEDVPLTGFGFRFYYCVLLAYTEVALDQAGPLKWFRKLRIMCAGIWHNFLFACLCFLLIALLGITTSPFFSYNQNVIITELTNKSPLRSKSTAISDRGLQVDNVITQINECVVHDEDSWYRCLSNTLINRPAYCISSDFIRLNDESIDISHHGIDGTLQCCDEQNPKLNCFEYIEDFSNDAPVEIPQHVCLNIRRTIEDSTGFCVSGSCEQGFCLRPLLHNSTTLLTFQRQTWHGLKLADVIYIGHPADVTRTVRISPFVPKQGSISSYWPDTYALLLKYNAVFNLGMAIMNAVPCFGFDGSYIVNTIIHSFLAKRVTERAKRDLIALIISGCGTALFGLALLKVLWLSVLRHVF